MTHDEVQALASEYVMGQLDEVTRARVASHLSSCHVCIEEVRLIGLTLDALARSVPAVEPPASLRDRIAAIPGTVPQARAATASTPGPGEMGASRLAPWFAAVAASLLAAVAIWQAVDARAEVQRLRQELAQMQVTAGQAQVARVSLERQLDEFAKQVDVLRASDLVAYSLAGSGTAVNAHARAYVTYKNGVVFTAAGLPALPSGKVYQLWVIVDAKPVSVGVFSPDADGRVHALVGTPDITAMPAAVAVTLEPAGGLPVPTMPLILVGTAQPR